MILFSDKWQQFLDEEADMIVAHAIIFKAAIATWQGAIHRSGQFARLDEHGNRHGHLSAGNEHF